MKRFIPFCILTLLSFCGVTLYAQEQKKIEILSSEALRSIEVNGLKANMLVGNVKLKQDQMVLNCDSALFFINVNAVNAFGHVHITQGDSLDIHSDSLKYNGDTKIADLFGHVNMRHGTTHLTTKRLTYFMIPKLAIYYDGGRITNESVDLVSEKGYYYSETKMSYFRKDVVMKDNDFTLYSDTLGYNTKTAITYFYGPTNIVTDTSNIYCESGWYDTKANVSHFGEKTVMNNKSQKLTGDSVYYDKATGFGMAFKNFIWRDTATNIIITGRRADFYRSDNHIIATDHAMLTYVMDSDSLFLTADTLVSLMSKDSIRTMFAFHHVKIYKKDLQGLCDSMFFTFRDSVMWMYRNPILWNEANQLTGDTITMNLRNKKIEKVELFKNGFVINQSDSGMYNQIKGRHVYGYFEESKLRRMYAKANGESLYYGKDDSGAYMGINKAVCTNIWIYLDSGQVSRVKFIGQPDATFTPIQRAVINDQKLKNFVWRIAERPLSKQDIMQKDKGDMPTEPAEDIKLKLLKMLLLFAL